MTRELGWACAIVVALVGGAAAQPARATLSGTVHDATGAPVGGVTIVAGSEFAATEDDGTFTLTLAPGAYDVQLSAPWLETEVVHVRLAAGETKVVTYVVRDLPGMKGEVIEVEGAEPVQPGKQRMDAAQARQVPGTSGDALKVVQSMPGVARPPPGSAELIVWGAAPHDTRVFVDGVPIPALYHVGGWRASVAGELVSEIALEPGAFGAAHGDAIGGIVDVATEVPDGEGAIVTADVLDTSVTAHTTRGATRVAGTGRVSYLDQLVEGTAGDIGQLVPVPRWADLDLTLAHPAGGGELRAFVLASGDRLTRTVDSDDPAAVKRQTITSGFARAGLAWHGDAAGGTVHATGWIGADADRLALRFGDVPADLDTTSWLAGARAEHAARHGDHVVLALGFDATAALTDVDRDGSLGTPAREGDVSIFGQPPGDDVAADAWRAVTIDAAPSATLDYVRGPVTISPGLRLDGYLLTASRLTPKIGRTPGIGFQRIELAPGPRLSARVRLGRATVTLDGGLYHQARRADDTSAVFGSPTLGLERAIHVATGVSVRTGPVSIEAVVYARWLGDLVARHPDATPPLAGALTQDGTGDVLGAQVVATLRPWRGLAGWISYGVSRSRRRDNPDAAMRLFDHDQTHLATAVIGYSRGAWSAGARIRVASGEPRTEVVGAYVDARSGRYQPIVGATNGIRLPAFVQLDLRGERRFAIAHTLLAAYVEVQNVTARDNPEELAYSADYGERGYITGLPLLAVAGIRWEL